jgi:CheY-like chemotaxis protein
MRILIVDDEAPARRRLASMLEEIASEDVEISVLFLWSSLPGSPDRQLLAPQLPSSPAPQLARFPAPQL